MNFNIFLFCVSWSVLFTWRAWPCPTPGGAHRPQPNPQLEENRTYAPRRERMWEFRAHFKMQEKHLLEGGIGRNRKASRGKGSLQRSMKKAALLGGERFTAVEQAEHDQGQDTGACRASVGQSLESHVSGVVWGRSGGRHHSLWFWKPCMFLPRRSAFFWTRHLSGSLSPNVQT